MLKSAIKRALLRLWPGLYYAITSLRFYRYCQKHFQPLQTEICPLLYPDGEIRILSGPFAGLRYYNQIVWGPIVPKWLGCYEQELHPVIAQILATPYTKIIDVGAAEGYYAVGLAWRSPQTPVVAYDVDPLARIRQRQLQRLNAVENLEIRGFCNHQELARQLSGRCLLVADIEGFELELLNPQVCPQLHHCDILVELHHCGELGVAEVQIVLMQRFAASHQIVEMAIAARDLSSLRHSIPQIANLDTDQLQEAVSEYRYETQCWLWLTAKW
ncbi:MAG: hypothetical protein HC838_11065, partial [Spirulinaceae cyanobacterium RM2_2_10]|nr:hypothetical protein [Spirulinaceae cyanobacterium RM2_2_10]